ncbi:Protein SRT-32 [Aphelenchoides avenae]|nr:Protein SRT-32 [Aphelenchus avenae]
MNRFWFRAEEYERLYNCSAYTQQQWYQFGEKHPAVGAALFTTSFVYQVVYLPFLVVMLKPSFYHMSCYKIMFFLGVIDFLSLCLQGTYTAYLHVQGAVFCTNPTAIYVVGCAGTALWCGSCMTCVLLALNRVVDTCRPLWTKRFFSGHRTYYWLLLPTGYILYVFLCEAPLVFNSKFYTCILEPFAGMPVSVEGTYKNVTYLVNNVVVVVVLCSAYYSLCSFVHQTVAKANTTIETKRQIVIQTTVICVLFSVPSAIQLCVGLAPAPKVLQLVGYFAQQAAHGSTGFVYLFLNGSLRAAVLEMLCGNKDPAKGANGSIRAFYSTEGQSRAQRVRSFDERRLQQLSLQ